MGTTTTLPMGWNSRLIIYAYRTAAAAIGKAGYLPLPGRETSNRRHASNLNSNSELMATGI
jgi:hypothetical protein